MSDMAIKQLFIGYAPALLRYLSRRCGDPTLAEDLVQESFLRLALHLRCATIDNPGAYLNRTACNLLIDHRRQQQRQRTELCELHELEWFEDRAPGPMAQAMIAQRRHVLLQAMAQLPPRTACVLRLNRLEGLSHCAVAMHLGISASSVQKHLAKAALLLPRHLRRCGYSTDGP